MILPNKVVKPNYSLIYIGGLTLDALGAKYKLMHIDELYTNVRQRISFSLSLERFLLALDFLYIIGKIELVNDKVLICS